MESLKQRIVSMPTRGSYSDGPSRHGFIPQWDPEPPTEATQYPKDYLYQLLPDGFECVELAFSALGSWAQLCGNTTSIGADVVERYQCFVSDGQIQLIPRAARIAGLGVLHAIYLEGRERASSAALTSALNAIFELAAQHQYSEINAILRSANVELLAPEFLVGFPRVTFRWRANLPAWSIFLKSALEQLRMRGGFDIAALFHGIPAISL